MVSWRHYVERSVASCLTYRFYTFNQAPTGTNKTTVLLWMSVGLCCLCKDIGCVSLFCCSDLTQCHMFYCLIFWFLYLSAFKKKKKKKENGFARISCTTLCANIYFQDHFSSVLKCYTTSIRQYLALYISGAVCGIVQNLLKGNKCSQKNSTNGTNLQTPAAAHTHSSSLIPDSTCYLPSRWK